MMMPSVVFDRDHTWVSVSAHLEQRGGDLIQPESKKRLRDGTRGRNVPLVTKNILEVEN